VAFSYAVNIEFTEEALRNAPEKQGIDLKAMPSYEFVPYKVNREAVNKRAEAVFKSNPVTRAVWKKRFETKDTNEEIIFSAENIEFRVSKAAGAEILMDLDRYTVAEEQREALEEVKLKGIADKYIKEQLPDLNLSEIKYTKIKKIMDAVGTFDPESKKSLVDSSQVANYIVVYERIIKGIPVIGSGEKIRIYLSSNGDPIGHSKVWRQLGKRVGVVKPVLSTDEIRKIFIRQHSKDQIESIKVDRLYFGYFAEGRYTKQKSLSLFYIIGYTYGLHSKRVLERYNAYTGEFVKPPKEKEGKDKKGQE
jgi:hypothetical protein